MAPLSLDTARPVQHLLRRHQSVSLFSFSCVDGVRLAPVGGRRFPSRPRTAPVAGSRVHASHFPSYRAESPKHANLAGPYTTGPARPFETMKIDRPPGPPSSPPTVGGRDLRSWAMHASALGRVRTFVPLAAAAANAREQLALWAWETFKVDGSATTGR